jgi:hypothetical protein
MENIELLALGFQGEREKLAIGPHMLTSGAF